MKFTEIRKRFRKSLFTALSASILATTFTPTISAFATENEVSDEEIQGVLNFNYGENVTKEDILYALSKEIPEIDLNGAVISEELDNYGNSKFVIETEKQETDYFNEITLDDVERSFLLDTGVESQRIGNVLTYVLSDGTRGEMIETFDALGRRVIQVTEGDKTNELIFDSVNNELKFDGNIVTSEENHVIVIQQDESTDEQRNTWQFLVSGNRDTRLQTAVRNATAGAVSLALSAVLPAKAVVTITIAQIIVNFYRDINSNNSLIYSTFRQYFRFPNQHRFVDRFYAQSRRHASDFITTRTVIEDWHH